MRSALNLRCVSRRANSRAPPNARTVSKPRSTSRWCPPSRRQPSDW